MKLLVILSFVFSVCAESVFAQDGTLDEAFGDDGMVLYLDAGFTTTANAVLVKPIEPQSSCDCTISQ